MYKIYMILCRNGNAPIEIASAHDTAEARARAFDQLLESLEGRRSLDYSFFYFSECESEGVAQFEPNARNCELWAGISSSGKIERERDSLAEIQAQIRAILRDGGFINPPKSRCIPREGSSLSEPKGRKVVDALWRMEDLVQHPAPERWAAGPWGLEGVLPQILRLPDDGSGSTLPGSRSESESPDDILPLLEALTRSVQSAIAAGDWQIKDGNDPSTLLKIIEVALDSAADPVVDEELSVRSA